MRVLRPTPNVIVITEPRVSAWLGLGVCLVIIAVFYYTFTINEDSTLLPTGNEQTGLRDWAGTALFLLLPVLLAPYLIRCLRVATTGDTVIFDGEAGTVTKNRTRIAMFAEVRDLRVKPVNNTCEELALCVTLAGGAEIVLYTGAAASRMFGLAGEIDALLSNSASKIQDDKSTLWK